MVLSPRESAKFIAANAKHVKIKQEGIKALGEDLIKQLKDCKLSPEYFSQNIHHPNPKNSNALDWIFVVDVLNFCFWSNKKESSWSVNNYTGYFALCAAITRAVDEKIDILNPKFYSNINAEQLQMILRSESGECPLIDERIKCLHEAGQVLIDKFDGSVEQLVKEARGSALKLLELIVVNFSCFRDEATYQGNKVAFYKRAQILISDIWTCYKNKNIGNFYDIDQLSMFADYRVPQSLIYYGIFEYDQELLSILNAGTLLVNGDPMEVEIRGCSIHAVELVKEYANLHCPENKSLNSIIIDHYLWDFRRSHAQEIVSKKIPFHKTLCIYY